MAIIQKIRDKYAKVAGGLIVVALIGFVLMDATSGGRSTGGLFGSSTAVAEVDGEEIDVTEYDAMVTAQEAQMRQQNRPMDEAATAQMRDQVMSQMIVEKLNKEIGEKLGLTVSASELKEMLNTANPDPMVKQAFTNPQTGEYNAENAVAAIRDYEKTKDPQKKAEWENFKKQLAQSKEQAKLSGILGGTYYTPKFVLDDMNSNEANLANIAYVNLPYTLVSDDKVKVTDEDVNKFVQDHKAMFEIKNENRNIDYVTFTIAPAAEDSARVRGDLDKLKDGLLSTDNVENFVKINSSTTIPVSYLTEENLNQMQIAPQINGAAIGSIVGPFMYGPDNMAIARVLEKATLPDTVKVRHILIATKQGSEQGMQNVRTDEQAQARVDSMIALEKSGVPFDSLIAKFSDDNIAQNPTGVYDLPLSQRSGFTKEFGDFAFSGAAVGATKVVKVESNGYSGMHYIQILGKGSKNEATTKVAFIVKPLTPDNNTYNKVYASASAFANQVSSDSKNFEKIASSSNLQQQTAQNLDQNSTSVQGLGASKDLIKWAFGAKKGDVSPIYTIGGNKIVIAKLSEINTPGLLKPSGNIKMSIESMVRNQKKAALLIEQNKAKTSLAEIASANSVEVGAADSVSFASNMIAGIGSEAKVNGYTFNKGFKENTLSPGIPGMNSVFFMTVNSRYTNPNAVKNGAAERKMMDAQNKSRAYQGIVEGMRQSAEVKDLRYKIYK